MRFVFFAIFAHPLRTLRSKAYQLILTSVDAWVYSYLAMAELL